MWRYDIFLVWWTVVPFLPHPLGERSSPKFFEPWAFLFLNSKLHSHFFLIIVCYNNTPDTTPALLTIFFCLCSTKLPSAQTCSPVQLMYPATATVPSNFIFIISQNSVKSKYHSFLLSYIPVLCDHLTESSLYSSCCFWHRGKTQMMQG